MQKVCALPTRLRRAATVWTGLSTFVMQSLKKLERDAQRSIQFVRSSSGVTTALVGMKQLEPLHGNLWAARVNSAASEKLIGLFGRQESK